MKIIVIAAGLLALSSPALANDVSVSIGINQPGFYGQINIGDYPRPAVVYAQPVIIERGPGYADADAVYLHVPPGHEKHWAKHCAEYHACGRRVYFVQDGWYRNEYARHQSRGDEHRDDRRHDDRSHEQKHGHKDEHRADHDDRDGRDR